jgi:hypothetical protein
MFKTIFILSLRAIFVRSNPGCSSLFQRLLRHPLFIIKNQGCGIPRNDKIDSPGLVDDAVAAGHGI